MTTHASATYEPYRQLWRLSSRPVFLVTDLIGVILLSLSQLVADPWKGVLAAVGSAVLTIGLSLPIALFYQLRANAESLSILDACNRAGIRAIFESRQRDNENLRRAIDAAAASSTEIGLLGVAFRSLFNPSGEYTRQMRERLDDPRVRLRVLLLDPSSPAAKLRAAIEEGNTTIEDIRFTLEHGIPATCKERLLRASQQHPDGVQGATASAGTTDVEAALTRCNCEVRTYKHDPMTFLMVFRDAVFSEQYHIGRPKTLRTGSCIGKHVPVVEFSGAAEGAVFLKEHFEALWKRGQDVTGKIVERALSMNEADERPAT